MDKPAGPTSHDVVARARRALQTRAVGHTGTLDPFATGLLVLLVGRGTRLARFVEQRPKTYLATARLGMRTTTDDLTGEAVDPQIAQMPAMDQIAKTLADMVGDQRQVPPAFSAKKVAGERAYHRARKGEAVALSPVEVMVEKIDLLDYTAPLVTFRAVVSAGTYVRALARDLGERLGCGAHLVALRREAIGELDVRDAIGADAISSAALRPLQSVVSHLEAVELDPTERTAIAHGRPIKAKAAGSDPVLLVQGPDLVAVARRAGEQLQPVVVLEGA